MRISTVVITFISLFAAVFVAGHVLMGAKLVAKSWEKGDLGFSLSVGALMALEVAIALGMPFFLCWVRRNMRAGA